MRRIITSRILFSFRVLGFFEIILKMEYQDIILRLQKVYAPGEARALARMALEERFGMTLTDIMCGKVTELSGEKVEELEKIILRLEKSEPIQYILGYETFCGHHFHVAPGVLIPRPETEELVEKAFHLLSCKREKEAIKGNSISKEKEEKKRVLDIGTGSGCIAVSIALKGKEAGISQEVRGWDISDEALLIAQRNGEHLKAGVTFEKRDILSEQRNEENRSYWDLIVSNPPYISTKEIQLLDEEVKNHDPHISLDGGDDGLDFYRIISENAPTFLKNDGMLVLEIGEGQANAVKKLLSANFKNIKIIKKLLGCFIKRAESSKSFKSFKIPL